MTLSLNNTLPKAVTGIVLVAALAACNNQQATTEPAPVADPAPTAVEATPATDPAVTDTHADAHDTATADGVVVSDAVITSFTAFGNHPSSWRATIQGNELVIDGLNIATTTLTTERSAYAHGVEHTAEMDGQTVNLNIRSEQCTDDDGNTQPFKATLDIGTTTYEGCAHDGFTEIADT